MPRQMPDTVSHGCHPSSIRIRTFLPVDCDDPAAAVIVANAANWVLVSHEVLKDQQQKLHVVLGNFGWLEFLYGGVRPSVFFLKHDKCDLRSLPLPSLSLALLSTQRSFDTSSRFHLSRMDAYRLFLTHTKSVLFGRSAECSSFVCSLYQQESRSRGSNFYFTLRRGLAETSRRPQ